MKGKMVNILPGMNAGASTYTVPSPIEGSGTAWVLLGSWALSPARPTPIHPRHECRGFSAFFGETEAMQDAEREVATTDYASIAYKNMLHTKLKYGAKRDELTTLTQMTNQFLKELENQRGFFEYQMRDIIRSINKEKDDETKRDYITYFNKTRVLFRESWGKSLTLFHEVLEKL